MFGYQSRSEYWQRQVSGPCGLWWRGTREPAPFMLGELAPREWITTLDADCKAEHQDGLSDGKHIYSAIHLQTRITTDVPLEVPYKASTAVCVCDD